MEQVGEFIPQDGIRQQESFDRQAQGRLGVRVVGGQGEFLQGVRVRAKPTVQFVPDGPDPLPAGLSEFLAERLGGLLAALGQQGDQRGEQTRQVGGQGGYVHVVLRWSR